MLFQSNAEFNRDVSKENTMLLPSSSLTTIHSRKGGDTFGWTTSPNNFSIHCTFCKLNATAHNQFLMTVVTWPTVAWPAFPCGFVAKNEEQESKTARKMARVKERGGALVPFFARLKPKIPFLGLSVLRNKTETLATQDGYFQH